MPRKAGGNAASDKRNEVLNKNYINSKLGKDELVQRLKKTATFLSDFNQDVTVRGSSFDGLAADLVTPGIIRHKDKDVKLLAACCLSDVLRIYAPDPPYGNDPLKSVFELFVKQLQGLEKTASASFARHFYLLERLAVVKSFIILIDMDAEELLVELFTMFLDIISLKHANKVESHMLDILVSIVSEADTISQELLDVILSHLVDPPNEASYKMAANIISRSADKLQHFVTQFFADALFRNQSSESDLSERAFDLLYELYKASPAVLLHTLPNVETLLKEEDLERRTEAVNLIAKMCCLQSNLAATNPPLFSAFLCRLGDVDAKIRANMAAHCKDILEVHPSLAKVIGDALVGRCHDTDEKVRKSAVSALSECCVLRPDAMMAAHLRELGDRLRDKKGSIRQIVQANLSKIYENAQNPSDEKFSWIPEALISLRNQEDTDSNTRTGIDLWLEEKLLGEQESVEVRTSRLVDLYCALTGNDRRNPIETVLVDKRWYQACLFKYVGLRAQKKSDAAVSLLSACIKRMSDHSKARDALLKFHDLKDVRIFKQLKIVVDPVSTFADIGKAMKELMSRLPKTNSAMVDTVRIVLVKAANRMACSDVVRCLFNLLDDFREEGDLNRVNGTLNLLVAISKAFPDSFMESFTSVAELVSADDESTVNVGLLILCKCGKWLQSMNAKLCKAVGKRLVELAVTGSPYQAKNAVRCIVTVFENDPKPVCNTLLKALARDLSVDNIATNLPTILKAYSYVALLCPEAFQSEATKVVLFVRETLLPCEQEMRLDDAEDDPNRAWDDLSPNCLAKMIGIKLLAHWVRGLKQGVDVLAPPILNTLFNLLEEGGEPCPSGVTADWDRAHLRLAAAKGLLKTARDRHIEEKVMTPEHFHIMAMTIQDSDYEVRRLFALKLSSLMNTFMLPVHFLAMFSLASVDPEKDNVDKAKKYLRHLSKMWRDRATKTDQQYRHQFLPEYGLPHLIHLLAHHPDFDRGDKEELHNFEKYLMLFLDSVTHQQDNFVFVKQMLGCLRSTVDTSAPTPSASVNIYALCELADRILSRRADSQKWSLSAFPGDLRIPSKLYMRPSVPIPQDAQVQYLPSSFSLNVKKTQDERILESPVKSPTKPATKSRASPVPRTRKTTTKRGTTSKPARKKRTTDAGPVLARGDGSQRKRKKASPAPRQGTRASQRAVSSISYREQSEESEENDDDDLDLKAALAASKMSPNKVNGKSTPKKVEAADSLTNMDLFESSDDGPPKKKKKSNNNTKRAVVEDGSTVGTPRRSGRVKSAKSPTHSLNHGSVDEESQVVIRRRRRQ